MMSIKDLKLAARTTINGFMIGINSSTLKGPGLEFSQYRSYQPGDDLRWLDWKMFARSDRYYVRESEIETSIAVRLLIDASNSMNHEDSGFRKIDYAKYLAASLAYLAISQGDAVGLYVFNEGELYSLPSRNDHQHLARLLHQLESIEPAGRFTSTIGYKELFAGAARRELMVFITDMYQEQEEIFQLINSVSSLRHEIIVFQVMGHNEMTLDFGRSTSLEDLETGRQVRIDPSKISVEYRQRLQQHLQNIKTYLLDRNVYYRLLTMDQPLDEALRDFLNQRNKLSR